MASILAVPKESMEPIVVVEEEPGIATEEEDDAGGVWTLIDLSLPNLILNTMLPVPCLINSTQAGRHLRNGTGVIQEAVPRIHPRINLMYALCLVFGKAVGIRQNGIAKGQILVPI